MALRPSGSCAIFCAIKRQKSTRIIGQTQLSVAVKNAKISNFKFHDLRHTTGTYLGRMKVPLHIIQQILGHSDPKMTMKYVTTVDETVVSEMSRVFEFKTGSKDGTNG